MILDFYNLSNRHVAEFIDPGLGDKSQLRHRVVVPARQATWLAGRYNNHMPDSGVDFIPQSGIYEFGYCM
jgi:hypothetical protein